MSIPQWVRWSCTHFDPSSQMFLFTVPSLTVPSSILSYTLRAKLPFVNHNLCSPSLPPSLSLLQSQVCKHYSVRGCFAEADTWEGVWCFAWVEAGEGAWCMEPHKQWGVTLALGRSTPLRSRCFTRLHFVERNAPKNFLWCSRWFWRIPLSLAVSAGSSRHCWFMFGVCYWTGLLVSWRLRVESPGNSFWTGPQSPFPVNLFLSLPLVSWLGFKINKIGLKKKALSLCPSIFMCILVAVLL